MIISAIDKQNNFALRWREDGKRKEKLIPYNDFQPYFYILEDDKEHSKAEISDGRSKFTIKVEYIKDGSVNLNGDKLKKVTWTPPKPGYTRTLRELWNKTFEADVPFHYRYSIDALTKIPEYDLVKWYWDLEWQQGGKHDGAITCISLTTNNGNEAYVWFPDIKDNPERLFHANNITVFNSEREMLIRFIRDLNNQDPDMLISWFGSKFDLPKLIERLHVNGIDPRKLSPYNDVKGVYWNDGVKLSKQAKGYSPIDQPIRGRLILNLDLAFERQWNDAQRGTLPSLALDYIAELVLGEKKLVSEKFPDKNEFFQRAWLEDTEIYLQYALKDTDLLKRIDEENYTSEAIIALQRLLIAPFDACFYASNMASIYFMRNASWKAPTGKREEKQHYKGAMIYEPSKEGTNGLHMGVAAFDFAGLYPSMMIARNISWETKSLHPTEFAVNLLTPRDFSDREGWGVRDMRYYKTNKLGLLPKAVLELKDLRDIYKKNMREATSDGEYVKWNNNQMAVKRLMASFYGIIGYQGFGWADVDLAASITASAREAIRSVAFKVMEL
jgi:DNA polymerase I